MKNALRALALLLALQPALAGAQQFPTVPANTVIGRLGIGTGPAQAIPFAALSQSMFGTISNNTVLGNVSGGSALTAALTATQLTTLCNTFTTSLKGCVPASAGGTTNFLRADGTFAAPPSPSLTSLLDAKNFGVVCDGITVNTTAWASAIAAFPSSGGTLILPSGVCLGTVALNKANIVFQGQGWSTSGATGTCGTEIRSTGAADNIILISASGVQVRDLCVTTSVAVGSRTGAGVKITGGPNVLLSRVFAVGHKYGTWTQSAGNEFEHVFTTGNATYGMYFDSSLGVGALNETGVYYCQANSNLGTAGIGFVGNGNASTGIFLLRPTAATNTGAGILISGQLNDIHLIEPELSSNTAHQLDATNGSGGNLTVSGGLIEVVAGGGNAINTGSAQQFVSITGNVITSTGVALIIQGSESTVVGNILGGQGAGNPTVAYGAAATKFTIASNSILGNSGAGEVGISVGVGATGCMIGANTFALLPTQITDGTAACTYASITTTKPTYP